MNNKSTQLVHRIIEYGINKEEIIVKQKLLEALQLSDIDEQYLNTVLLTNETFNINPNHIMVRVSDSSSANHRDWQYRILPTAINSYYEYMELQEARKNATDAKTYSILAIIISTISLILGFAQAFGVSNPNCN
jgi:hypothetical protein